MEASKEGCDIDIDYRPTIEMEIANIHKVLNQKEIYRKDTANEDFFYSIYNQNRNLTEDGHLPFISSLPTQQNKEPRTELIGTGSHRFLNGVAECSALDIKDNCDISKRFTIYNNPNNDCSYKDVRKSTETTRLPAKYETSQTECPSLPRNYSNKGECHATECCSLYSDGRETNRLRNIIQSGVALFGASHIMENPMTLCGSKSGQYSVVRSSLSDNLMLETNSPSASETPQCKASQNSVSIPGISLLHGKSECEQSSQCASASASASARTLSSSSESVMHNGKHTLDKSFPCDICGKSFTTRWSVVRHKKLHTGEKPFQCDICQKSFTYSWNLTTHRQTHTSDNTFKCNICQKSFTYPWNLTAHIQTHTSENTFQCDICQKSFTYPWNLTAHRQTHTSENTFQCDICQKSFTYPWNLTAHRQTHTSENTFQCDICQKSFSHRGNLTAHKWTHAGTKKPFQCDVCPMSFCQNSLLTRHKRKHAGEKPFQCDICKMSFGFSHVLKTHKRVHTGEKPYRCDVCQKKFRHSHVLTRHRRRHTREKSFLCDT